MRMISLAGAIFLLATAPALAAPEQFTFDKNHADITFTVSHLGLSDTHGRFGDFDGTVTLDPDDPAASKVDVTIDAASVTTFYAPRDEHLRKPDFFDVANHPTLTFVSTDVKPTGDRTAAVTGDLTIRGVTRPVTLDVTLNKLGPHPMTGDRVAGFTARGTIERSEFGMTYGIPAVSDEVEIVIDVDLAAVK